MKNEPHLIEPKQLLTTAEAAAYLDLNPQTLERWRRRGCGPEYVKLGSNVRYSLSKLNDYVREQTVTTKNKISGRKGSGP